MGSCLDGSLFTGHDYRRKEETLFKRIKELQTSLADISARCASAEYALNTAKAEWITKENDYLEQLNDLQGRLHQQDVIVKQYKIYENNLENERQTMIELQTQIEQLKEKFTKAQKSKSATCEGIKQSSSATTCQT